MKNRRSSNTPFTLFYRKGNALLTVNPSSAGQVYTEDILARCRLLGIKRARRLDIDRILKEASGSPVVLCPWPEGRNRSSQFTLLLSEDKMQASLKITPPRPGGEALTEDTLAEYLEEEGIVRGIDGEALNRLIKCGKKTAEAVVARGKEPEPPRSAFCKLYFTEDRGKPFRELAYGRIDLKELNFIQNATVGALLAKRIPPHPGAPGFTVTGEILEQEELPSEKKIQAGAGCRFSETDQSYYADISGNIVFEKEVLSIEPLVEVDQVDYSNGNMDVDGSIHVKKGIADGFTLRATGDIQIGKTIGKTRIFAKRDLILKTGVNGNGEGKIESGGDLYARFIESTEVICGGNLYVEEAILNSRIVVQGDIYLTGRRAELMGGILKAGGSLSCKKIGSMQELPTALILGIPPETLEQLDKQEKKIEQLHKQRDELEAKLIQLGNLRDLPEAKTRLFRIKAAERKLEEENIELNRRIGEELKTLHEMRKEMKPSDTVSCRVEQRIFPGVTLTMGNQEYRSPDNGTGGTILTLQKGMLLEKGYHP